MKLLLLIAATCLTVFGSKKSSKDDLSNGFRTEIDWVAWDKAVGVAKDLNKPIFFLIHKTWCGACKDSPQNALCNALYEKNALYTKELAKGG
ncbi:hypothetical protein COOONC_15154 [Cooperia oncophora]